jgi:6-phosphogluconolactonase (cycloisomerase 2 family)
LSLPSSPKDILLPTGVNVLTSGSAVYAYVSAYDTTANTGYVFGFAVGSGGVLSPLNGGQPFLAGTNPSSVTSDGTGSYVYATDFAQGKIWAYAVASGSGLLTPLSGSPFASGDEPMAMVVDSAGKYAYVANSLDSNVTAYSVSSGTLSYLGTFATGTEPVAIGIDPSTKHFLYTANFLGGTVSGFELSTTDGSLLNTQFSPYTSNAQPTAVAAIPHGSTK